MEEAPCTAHLHIHLIRLGHACPGRAGTPAAALGMGNAASRVNRLPPKQFAQIAQVSLHGTNMSHANYSCSVHTERGVFARIMHTHERLIKMTLGGLVFVPQLAGGDAWLCLRGNSSVQAGGVHAIFPSAVWPPWRVFFPSPRAMQRRNRCGRAGGRAGGRGSGGFGRGASGRAGEREGLGGRRSARRWRRGGCVVINERRLPARPRYLLGIIQRRVLMRRRFSRDEGGEGVRACGRFPLSKNYDSCIHLAPRMIPCFPRCRRFFKRGIFISSRRENASHS